MRGRRVCWWTVLVYILNSVRLNFFILTVSCRSQDDTTTASRSLARRGSCSSTGKQPSTANLQKDRTYRAREFAIGPQVFQRGRCGSRLRQPFPQSLRVYAALLSLTVEGAAVRIGRYRWSICSVTVRTPTDRPQLAMRSVCFKLFLYINMYNIYAH